MSQLFRYLLWLALGGGMVTGCGPGLSSQVRLNGLGDRAAAHCEAQDRKAKCKRDPKSAECAQATAACRDALRCVVAVRDSVSETQRVQIERAVGSATEADETVARMREDEATIACRAFDPKTKPPAAAPVAPKPLESTAGWISAALLALEALLRRINVARAAKAAAEIDRGDAELRRSRENVRRVESELTGPD